MRAKKADITIVDVDNSYTIDKNKFVSMGKNTPFDKKKVKGKVLKTIVNGEIVFEDNDGQYKFIKE